MGWLAWIILGGVAGWIASMLTKNNERLGLVGNVLIGIIGAFAGNFLVNLIMAAAWPVSALTSQRLSSPSEARLFCC